LLTDLGEPVRLSAQPAAGGPIVAETEITLFPNFGLSSATAWLQYERDWQAGTSGPMIAGRCDKDRMP
jgi:hypothetical protein